MFKKKQLSLPKEICQNTTPSLCLGRRGLERLFIKLLGFPKRCYVIKAATVFILWNFTTHVF